MRNDIHDDPFSILQDSLVQQASGEQLSEDGRGEPAHAAQEEVRPGSTSLPAASYAAQQGGARAEAGAANHPGAAHGLLVQLHLEQGVLEVAAEPPGSRQVCTDCLRISSTACNACLKIMLVLTGLLELLLMH